MSIKSFISGQVVDFLNRLPRATSEPKLHILCAVSGGADSMVLLDLLAKLRGKGLEVSAAHFNHGLREASRIEEQLVRAYAKARGVTLFVEQAPPRDPRVNLEAWAREKRYAFLENARAECGADYIATAHQRDDQAETLLMRLLAGRLMTDARSIAAVDPGRNLIRPLLAVRRQEIEQYAHEVGLTFALDQTNYQLDRTRNIIRHRVLPEFAAELNPVVVDTLADTAGRVNEDESYLWQSAEARLSQAPLGRAELNQMPQPLRWRVLALLAEAQLGKEARKIGYRNLQDALRLIELEDAVERLLHLGFGVQLRVNRRGEVAFEQIEATQKERPAAPQLLTVPGAVTRNYNDGSSAVVEAELIGEAEFLAEGEISFDQGDPYSEASAFFDWENLSESGAARSIFVRERLEGDRIRVLGRGERKLKKLLQERGLILTLRDRIPIVLLGSTAIWVPGIARAEVAPISGTSRTLLRLTYRRLTLS